MNTLHTLVDQKKLTFKIWWEKNQYKAAFSYITEREAELIWNAAQENK